TGRCVDRSIQAYRFDKPMREQIMAADVFCRAPGCLRPASRSQLDHVQEYGTQGGHTCEANGQAACEPHHDQKTKKAWDAVIDANRDVTWTTLLGRVYRTKAHDYNQYTRLLTAATAAIDEAIGEGVDPSTAVDAAIYQALSYRPPQGTLEADDDSLDWDSPFAGWDQVILTHTDNHGQRRYRPDPDTAQTEASRHDATVDRQDDGARDAQDEARDGEDTGPASPWNEDPDATPPF
ncbi:MAG TPA: HNH endonuclease signature motif containing protein, partial [Ornithinicoccus sp.]|nr:HNH endonuclease signature motif containing protein [Ornithinicoccus sp.]